MTDLTEAERATVERFEQAPDALGEVALTDDQYRTFAVALCLWWDGQGEAEACHVDDDARPCGACGEEADALAPVVARMVAEAADARPWRDCTGAGDCPEPWHVHGCYADMGQCDDPTDHHDLAADAREAEVRERVEEWLPTLDPVAQSVIRAALAPAGNDGEARPQQPPDATPYLPPLPDEIECCASGSCEVCRR